MTSSWSLEAHSGQAGYQKVLQEWLALVESDPDTTYMQHPDWFGAYLDTMAPHPERIKFLCARSGRVLRAILPVEAVHAQGGVWPSSYRLINGPHMHLSDLCVASSDSEAVETFFQLLSEAPPLRWLRLHLQSVHEGSALSRAVSTPSLEARSLTAPRCQTTWLDCSAGVDTCLARVSKSFKQNVKRLGRRAEGLGKVEYEVVTCPQRIHWALDEFLGVEGSGWKTQAGTDIAHDPRLVAFYRALAQRFANRGKCRINLLSIDGKTVAAQFGLVSAGQLNLLKIGYDADFASIAPGNLIMQRTIETVCADPTLERLSFVTNPPWAHLWKPFLLDVQDRSVFHPGWIGLTALKATRWLRTRQERKQLQQAAPAPLTEEGTPAAEEAPAPREAGLAAVTPTDARPHAFSAAQRAA